MIPLMFIQKKENLLKETTAAITKMSARYSHLRHAIEIDFRMNADMHFTLVVHLNQFDMPKDVYVKTLIKSDYIKVDPSVPYYTIEGDREVVRLTYDDLIKIARNAVSYSDVENWDIKSKMLNPDKDPDVFMDLVEYDTDEEIFSFRVNGKKISYFMDGRLPSISVNDDEAIKPRAVIGNYYVFDVELDGVLYSIALIHIEAFKNHYLFRQTRATHKIYLKNNLIIDGENNEMYFFNGMVNINNKNHSLQKYLSNQYNNEYKQYFFNALRDKNLYTEIANAFNILKHNSFMVYDLENDERLTGRVKATIEFNEKSIPELVIRLSNLKNQFNEQKEGVFEFRTIIYNLPNIVEKCNKNYRLIDYGYFLYDKTFIPIARSIVNIEEQGYVTASNNKHFLSLSLRFLKSIMESTLVTTVPSIKEIDEGIYTAAGINVLDVDFENRKVVVNNVFDEYELSFDEVKESDFFIVHDARLFSDSPDRAFGLKFNAMPQKVSFNPITPDKLNQVLLMIKKTESDEVTLDEIINSTNNLSYAMEVDIMNRQFLFVYNALRDKIYYIDLTNQDSSQDIEGVESMSAYISIDSIYKLKKALNKYCIREFMVRNRGFGVNVDKDLNVVPYVVYSSMRKPVFSSILGLEKPHLNVGYIVDNHWLKVMYKYATGIYKEVFRGIYETDAFKISSIEIIDSGLKISGLIEGGEKSFVVEIDNAGEYRCYNVLEEQTSLPFDKGVRGFETFGPIAFRDEFAIDMNIVAEYLKTKNLLINNEALVVRENETVYLIADTLTSLNRDINFNYDKTTTVAVENWFGKELYGIITVDTLEDDGEDCYYKSEIYSDEKIMAVKVPVDLAKYIVKP